MARAGAIHAIGAILAASEEEDESESGYVDSCSSCLDRDRREEASMHTCHPGPRWLQMGTMWDWEDKNQEKQQQDSIHHRCLLFVFGRLPSVYSHGEQVPADPAVQAA
jgi:hypothetical protein